MILHKNNKISFHKKKTIISLKEWGNMIVKEIMTNNIVKKIFKVSNMESKA